MTSLPRTVTRQRRRYDLNLGPFAPESSTLTTRLTSLPVVRVVELIAALVCNSEQQQQQQQRRQRRRLVSRAEETAG